MHIALLTETEHSNPISVINYSCKRHEMLLIFKLGTVHSIVINEHFVFRSVYMLLSTFNLYFANQN